MMLDAQMLVIVFWSGLGMIRAGRAGGAAATGAGQGADGGVEGA